MEYLSPDSHSVVRAPLRKVTTYAVILLSIVAIVAVIADVGRPTVPILLLTVALIIDHFGNKGDT